MLAGTLLYAFSSLAFLFTSPFWPFLLVRVFQGIGYAFFNTASVTLIANISSTAHLGQSLSYFYLAFNLSTVLAPPLGIFLINHFSFTLLFVVCIGLSLCSLFIANRLGRRRSDLSPEKRTPWLRDNHGFFVCHWTLIANSRMSTLSVVKQFYVTENAASGFRACLVILKTNALCFERMEKALHRGIIPTIAFPAHTAQGTQVA